MGMQKPDKAPEPSMEEILASIRKIIAEEPIGTRPGPAVGSAPRLPEPESLPAPPAASTPATRTENPGFTLPDRDEPRFDGPPYSVEDALADLIDDSPLNRIRPAAMRDDPVPKPNMRATPSAEEENERAAWPFGRPGAAPTRAPTEAAGPAARGADGMPSLGEGARQPSAGTPSAEPAAAKGFPTQKSTSSGEFFERAREALRPAFGESAPLPTGQQPDLARPAAARAPAAPAAPVTAPVAPRAEAPSVGAPQPAMRSPETVRDAGPALPVGVSKDAVAAPASVAKALAPDEARAPAVESKPALIPKRPDSAPQGAAAPLPVSEPAKVQATPVSQPAAPASPSGVRTLEDTVADLLRPMLREWLDANMPRIVEKALRGELAAGVKRPGSAEPR